MATAAVPKNRSIELLEESLQLLRSDGAILLQHWTGSFPFALALLLMLHDSGLSWGRRLLLRDSLACAAAFIWLGYWKSRMSQTVYSLLSPNAFGPQGPVRRACLQAVFQSLKLIVMPFAVISILGWPPASVFFRTLALEPLSQAQPIRSGFGRAVAAAGRRYAENSVAFLTIAALALVIWLNVLVAIVLAPSLWKTFTGYETDWSRMGAATLAGLVSVAAITAWLLVDPWIQTYSMLRVFYQNARSDGRDLLRDIARLAALALLCIVSATGLTKAAEKNEAQQSLNEAIQRAAQTEDYGWLRPGETRPGNGFLAEVAQKINDSIASARRSVQHWWRSSTEWLRELLRDKNVLPGEKVPGAQHSHELRWTLAILAVLICGGVVALFFRRMKTSSAVVVATTGAVAADVMNEQILPSEVKQEEWLRLASEYLTKNETRLAARAFYLANLSYLGTQNMLALSLAKSNKLYERELARRPGLNEISAAFSECNRLYERAWYGMRELGYEQVERLRGAVDQLRQHA